MEKKTVKQLHNEHDKFPEHKTFYLSYRYSKTTKSWTFMGYRCIRCGITFVRPNTIPNHTNVCKFRNKAQKLKDKEEELTIVTTEGKPWKSFVDPEDFNQN